MAAAVEQASAVPPDAQRRNSAVAPGPAPLLANGLQPLSCLRCAHRKVKCDRISPCTNCSKHAVSCEFPPPKTEKRKRRRAAVSSSSHDLQARLDRYEDLLKGLGVDVESVSHGAPHAAGESSLSPKQELDPSNGEPEGDGGRLLVHGKRSRYVHGNLWTKISPALENAASLLPDSSEDESEDETAFPSSSGNRPGFSLGDFGFSTGGAHELGALPMGFSLHTSHIEELFPAPEEFARLWAVFTENVHPVTMIIHVPSTTGMMTQASKGHGCAPRDVEALMFAALAIAVVSLSDADCVQKFGQKKSSMLARYRSAAALALINSKYLISSNLGVLQAFMFYLLAIRPDCDPRAVWNLTGIARRNGQRLGLHQPTATNGLTQFEMEMRRRLWYQIVMLDAIASQTAGTGSPRNLPDLVHGVQPPTNVNESDLDPNMKEPPQDRTGATDVIFCRLRFKIFSFMIWINSGKNPWVVPTENFQVKVDMSHRSERQKIIDETEKEIELEILRYCDLLNPIHYLTATVARLILCKMRFSVLHPRQYSGGLQELTKEDRDLLFSTAMKVLEYDNSSQAQPSLKGFHWHSHQHFQWSCLVHVLDDLKTRTNGAEADKAWEQIRLTYEYRPDLSLKRRPKIPLYSAVNKLVVTAWGMKEKAAAEVGEQLQTPPFILALRRQLELDDIKRANSAHGTFAGAQFPNTPQSVQSNESVPVANGDPISVLGLGNVQEWPDFNVDATGGFDGVNWSVFDSLLTQEVGAGYESQANGVNVFPQLDWTMSRFGQMQ